MEENVSIEKWVLIEAARLLRFVGWWNMHASDEENFPQEMPLGEWDEQFRFYDE